MKDITTVIAHVINIRQETEVMCANKSERK